MNVVSPVKNEENIPVILSPTPSTGTARLRALKPLPVCWRSDPHRSNTSVFFTLPGKEKQAMLLECVSVQQKNGSEKEKKNPRLHFPQLLHPWTVWNWNSCSNCTDQNDLINYTNMSLIVLNLSNEQVSAALKFKRHCVSPKLIYSRL